MLPNNSELHRKEDPLTELYAIVDDGTLTLEELQALRENLEAKKNGENSDAPLSSKLTDLIERMVGVIKETSDFDASTKAIFIKATLGFAINKVAEGIAFQNLFPKTNPSINPVKETLAALNNEALDMIVLSDDNLPEPDEFPPDDVLLLQEGTAAALTIVPDDADPLEPPKGLAIPAATILADMGFNKDYLATPQKDEELAPAEDPVQTAMETLSEAARRVNVLTANLQALGWTFPYTAARARKTALEAELEEAKAQKAAAKAALNVARTQNSPVQPAAEAPRPEVAKPASRPVEAEKKRSFLDTLREGFGTRARLAATALLGGALALGASSLLKESGVPVESANPTTITVKADTPTPSEATLPAPESRTSVTASTEAQSTFSPSNTLWGHLKSQGLEGKTLAGATNTAIIKANLHLNESQLYNPKALNRVTKEMAKWGGYEGILKGAKGAENLKSFLDTVPADQKPLVEGMAASVLGPISIDLPAAPQKASEQVQSAAPTSTSPMDAPMPGTASQTTSTTPSATIPTIQRAPMVDTMDVPEPSLPNRP